MTFIASPLAPANLWCRRDRSARLAVCDAVYFAGFDANFARVHDTGWIVQSTINGAIPGLKRRCLHGRSTAMCACGSSSKVRSMFHSVSRRWMRISESMRNRKRASLAESECTYRFQALIFPRSCNWTHARAERITIGIVALVGVKELAHHLSGPIRAPVYEADDFALPTPAVQFRKSGLIEYRTQHSRDSLLLIARNDADRELNRLGPFLWKCCVLHDQTVEAPRTAQQWA